VIPRKLPGPDNTLVDARPIYDAAIKTGGRRFRRSTAARFPGTSSTPLPFRPRRAWRLLPTRIPAASKFGCSSRTRSRQQCRIPGIQIPIALGATSKLPIGLELDGLWIAIAGCSRSAWRSTPCSGACRRRV